MHRRDLLKLSASLPLASLGGRLFAAPAAPARFLLVFLRGGYDAANLLVPVSSSFYYEARPNIAIARPSVDPLSAIPLNADWGLHPALRGSIHPLYAAGQAAFIPFAGTDDTSRSHFETQDSIERGQSGRGGRNLRSGFMNRLAGVLGGAAPMAFTDQLPLAFQGPVQVPNVALRNLRKPGIDGRQSEVIAAMYAHTPMARQVSEGFDVRDQVNREMQKEMPPGGMAAGMSTEMQAASRNAIGSRGFEAQARRVARLMRDSYNLGFIDVGGWDTHVGEGGASGYLAGRLGELGRGLSAFAQELGPAWRETVVLVVSEFGRTFRENGNHGTDHGHGSVYWLLGGAIKGGAIHGEQTEVARRTLFQDRDYPVLNEYRALMAGMFARLYGLDARRLQQVFADVRPKDIGIL